MNNYFLVKNLYDYEYVIPPPVNLPKNLKTVYITDTDENEKLAISLGWDIVKKTNLFIDRTDKFDRRKSVAFINSFPLKVVPEIVDANFIFICDSNIVRLWDLYDDFVKKCSNNFALSITSGYYTGSRDNILAECDASCINTRWSYGHKDIIECTNRYVKEMSEKNIDVNKVSVVSAKFIGWCINHSDYEKLSNILYEEYCKNLQGNSILTYMSAIHKEKIYNYHTNNYTGSQLNPHKFDA